MPSPARVLFVLKHRTFESVYSTGSPYESGCGDGVGSPAPDGSPCYTHDLSSGLTISVDFVIEMLTAMGVQCKVVQVIDNNCIDREVHLYNPTHVIIEALWVVPDKFEILHKLHPDVHWLVRIHSEITFLSNEGIAIDWLTRCAGYPKVAIAANSKSAQLDILEILRAVYPQWTEHELHDKAVYLPNYYSIPDAKDWVDWFRLTLDPHVVKRIQLEHKDGVVLNVACFGSIRPLKNNLIQAVGALRYADSEGVILHFHINGERTEGGDNVLKNLRALFVNTKHALIEHPWMEHGPFLRVLSWMDVSLCVSLSETFCIVAADSIAVGVPTVVSSEVNWASVFAMADPTNSRSIEHAIKRALMPAFHWLGAWLNRRALRKYCHASKKAWARYLHVHEK